MRNDCSFQSHMYVLLNLTSQGSLLEFQHHTHIMVKADILILESPSPRTSVRLQLLSYKNDEVVNSLCCLSPYVSFLLHGVAGKTIYCPVPTSSMESRNMVDHKPGSFYFNVTSQSICLRFGAVAKSTFVNQFAQALEEDMPKLQVLGRTVYQQTTDVRVAKIVKVALRAP